MMKDFIKSVANGAKEGWSDHKVLPSIAIAQAILESDWGRSELAKKANNLFGIKGDYNGYAYFKDSWEVIDGKNEIVRSAFRHYPSTEESIRDHGSFFTSTEWRKNNYKNVIGETDYKKVAKALRESGYATDPNYDQKLIEIVEYNDLQKYDEVAIAEISSSDVLDPLPDNKPPEEDKKEGEVKDMPRILLIAGHGRQRDGSFDPGASGFVKKGEYRYMVQDLFPAMKKYLPKNADVIFYDKLKVSNHGNLTSIVREYKADEVIEFHFDAFHNSQARQGHVIIHSDYAPDKLDLRLRDAIKNMVGVRYSHKGAQGISGRSNLYNVNVARNYGITYRLLELGFGTNRADADIMMNKVDEYAKELVKAIWDVKAVTESNTKPKKDPVKTIGDSYTVKPGDTLSAIAKQYKTTVAKLVEHNDLKDANVINVGQDIEIPANIVLYTVKSGDTLSAIAKRYGTTVNAIMGANDIKDANLIRVGQEIRIADSKQEVKADPLPKFIENEKVRIKKTASTYATGQPMPSRVKGTVDTIQQVASDRVLLKDLYSWVKKSDLERP